MGGGDVLNTPEGPTSRYCRAYLEHFNGILWGMRCEHSLCTGKHSYSRAGDMCPAALERKRAGMRSKAGTAWRSWNDMKSRCFNPNKSNYHRCGDRLITVCAGMLAYKDFLHVMGERPEGTSIDRIDNDRNYSCGECEQCVSEGWTRNVQWATWDQQMDNKTQVDGSFGRRRIVHRRGWVQPSKHDARGGKSRFSGVEAAGDAWRAVVQDDGTLHRLGNYDTEEDAARARDAFIHEHGIVARLNFPGEDPDFSVRDRRRTRRLGTTSSYRGVGFHKSSETWRARVNYRGSRKGIGYFRTEEEAARAYDTKVRELGLDKPLNFPG